MTAADTKRLDRIEAKLDRLLAVLAPSLLTPEGNADAAVFASGGVKALKEYVKAESMKRARGVK